MRFRAFRPDQVPRRSTGRLPPGGVIGGRFSGCMFRRASAISPLAGIGTRRPEEGADDESIRSAPKTTRPLWPVAMRLGA